MTTNKKETHGGAGRNQGRKLKYGEKTVTVNYRVPASKKSFVDKLIGRHLDAWAKIADMKKA